MTDYKELIRQLKTYEDGYGLYADAAAAIEALQVELAVSKGAIRILNYNIEQMKEDRMKQIEKEMARLKREVQE